MLVLILTNILLNRISIALLINQIFNSNPNHPLDLTLSIYQNSKKKND